MTDKQKYTFIKIIICLHAIKIHRKVYDKQYQQDYKITLKDKPLLLYYRVLTRVYSDFRCYLKRWKPILIRGYNQKRLTITQQIAFWKIRKINTERYSSYPE